MNNWNKSENVKVFQLPNIFHNPLEVESLDLTSLNMYKKHSTISLTWEFFFVTPFFCNLLTGLSAKHPQKWKVFPNFWTHGSSVPLGTLLTPSMGLLWHCCKCFESTWIMKFRSLVANSTDHRSRYQKMIRITNLFKWSNKININLLYGSCPDLKAHLHQRAELRTRSPVI